MTRPFRTVVPSTKVPVVDRNGNPTVEYQRFFGALVSPPQKAEAPTLATSPATYTASITGTLFVSGGTVSDISISRGQSVIPAGVVAGPIPLAGGDVATITYSVKPTVNFLPS